MAGAGGAKTVASAPGKVLLTGAYLVLERPNPGLVLSTSSRFYAIVESINEATPTTSGMEPAIKCPVKAVSPQLKREQLYELDINQLVLTPVQGDSTIMRNPFLERSVEVVVAAALLLCGDDSCARGPLLATLAQGLSITIIGDNDFYSQRQVLKDRSLPLTSTSLASLPRFAPATTNSVPPAGTESAGQVAAPEIAKTGLGSSAAMVAAVVGALLRHLAVVSLPSRNGPEQGHVSSTGGTGTDVAASDSLSLVHRLAQAAHCAGQGKVGSGFDVSAAVFGSQRYVRFSPAVLANLSAPPAELVQSVMAAHWDEDCQLSYSLPPGLTLVVGEPGAGGSSTPSMVGAVQRWRKAEPGEATRIWDGLVRANGEVEAGLTRLRELAAWEPATWHSAIRECSSHVADKWEEVLQNIPGSKGMAAALLGVRSAFQSVRELLREMGERAGVPIEPPQQTELLDASCLTEGVLFAGVPGAGGYDAVFAVVLGSSARLDAVWGSKNVLALLSAEDCFGVCQEERDPRLLL